MNILKEMLASSAKGGSKVEFVGEYVTSYAGTTSSKGILLTSLTNGLDTQPSEGDLVIAMIAIGEYSLYSGTVATPSGWTDLSGELFADDTYDTKARIIYKFMGSLPDSNFFIPNGTGNTACAGTTGVLVFRGVNQSNPFDVTPQFLVEANTRLPDPPPITPITSGAIVAIFGASGMSTSYSIFNNIPDVLYPLSAFAGDTVDCANGIGIVEWAGGTVNTGQWSHTGGEDTANSNVSASIALRPA